MRRMQRCLVAVLVFVVLLSWTVGVNALHGTAREGSLLIQLDTTDGQPLPSARLKLYQVAVAQDVGDDLRYALTQPFQGSGADVNAPVSAQLAKRLLAYATASTPHESRITDANGEASFDGLAEGLYLLVQDGYETDRPYLDIEPFVAPVPYHDQSGWAYRVSAAPKVEKRPTPTPTPDPRPTQRPTPRPDRLPQTGLLWEPVLLLGLVGLGLLVAGLALLLSARRGQWFKRLMGIVLMALGLLLLLLSARRMMASRTEAAEAEATMEALLEAWDRDDSQPAQERTMQLPKVDEWQAVPDLIPAPSFSTPIPEMPEKELMGERCVGMLELPTLGLSLPILSQWDYDLLRKAPCRYTGNVYENNMVLMAHNYQRHFGSIGSIGVNDPVQFVDANGQVYRYQVALVETLEPTQVEDMVNSPWDLSLFTCTIGGKRRVTVRLNRVERF